MLQAFVITLREGLEAFLIVAISLAYLRKTGRPQLVSAVHWGIGVAIVVSVGAAVLFQRANNQALWEGILALTAAVLVASLIVHMWRHAKRLKKDIEARLEALLMGTLLFQEAGMNILIGAVAGTLCAAFVAWLWSRYGHRVNLALFFQVTAVFLSVFVVQLLIYGFHELTEANLFPYSEPLHWATEPYGPDGRYGQFLTYLLVALPLGWLVFAALFAPKRSSAPPMQQTAAR
jgi:high-affinity iron transporter